MTTLCFIDTETTGLNPEQHEVWEVACIIRTYIEGDDLEQVRAAGGDLGESVAAAYGENSYVWQLPVDLSRADTIALNINRFHKRRHGSYHGTARVPRADETVFATHGVQQQGQWTIDEWCSYFARLTWGAHMIGMVPSFDTDRFLERLVRRHGACPGWHYQPIDVETLAVGSILGSLSMMTGDEVNTKASTQREIEATPEIVREGVSRLEMSRRFFLERAALPWDSERLSSWFGIEASRYDRHSALGDAQWARDLWDAIHESAQP